jgi:energy-converting hydrogenase Eha subunit F
MGLFSISDLVISLTLFLNAIALLATKPKNLNSRKSSVSFPAQHSQVHQSQGTKPPDESTVPLKNNNEEFKDVELEDQQNSENQKTIQQRFEQLVDSIRRASGVIVLWNIFYAILLILVFRG